MTTADKAYEFECRRSNGEPAIEEFSTPGKQCTGSSNLRLGTGTSRQSPTCSAGSVG